MKKTIRDLTLTGLGIALCFVATMYLKIPNAISGYFNMGDGIILLFSSILNPVSAFLVGGVGSAMADFVGGYPHYVIFTLIIKGCQAIVVSLLFQKFGMKVKYLAYGLGATIMVFGYFFAKWYLKGNVYVAISGLTSNIIQGIAGIIVALALLPVIYKMVMKYRSEL
ncbi:MAG: ECF transporter S component [Erysipelotrichaceae bacterium]|nr:ECF transporter S component [Erysipelotrichaceae bacterium]